MKYIRHKLIDSPVTKGYLEPGEEWDGFIERIESYDGDLFDGYDSFSIVNNPKMPWVSALFYKGGGLDDYDQIFYVPNKKWVPRYDLPNMKAKEVAIALIHAEKDWIWNSHEDK